MDVSFFVQQVVNGLVLGSVYAMVALGYTMVYGIVGLINFAHGEVLMFGAMIALSVVWLLQWLFPDLPGLLILFFAVIVAIPCCIALNLSIERIAYRPLRNAPRLAPLITAIGVSMMLQSVAMFIWGRNNLSFPSLINNDPVHWGPITVTYNWILIVVVSTTMMVGLLVLIHKTKLGRAMRATAESPQVASLMGINPNAAIAAAFAIGAALAAVAGVLMASNYAVVQFSMGFMPGLKAFTAAVLGGIGNLGGAMVGGVLLGLIESLGAGYIGTWTGGVLGSHYQDIFAFIVLIAVLVFRPSGLLGERVADRA